MFNNFLFIEKAHSSRKRGGQGRGKKRKNMPGYVLAVNKIGHHYWKPVQTVQAVYEKKDYIANRARTGDIIKRKDGNVTVLGTLGANLVTYDPVSAEVGTDNLRGERSVVLRGRAHSLFKQKPGLLKRTLFNGRLTVADIVKISKRQSVKVVDELIDTTNWRHVGENRRSGVQQSHWVEDPKSGALHLVKENERPANSMDVIAPSAVLERFASELGDLVGVPVNTVFLGKNRNLMKGVVSLHRSLKGTEQGKAKTLDDLVEYNDGGWGTSSELEKHEASKDRARIAMFDAFLLNLDRHNGNIMVDEDGRLFAIDHSFAVTPARIKRFYENNGSTYSGAEGVLKAVLEDRAFEPNIIGERPPLRFNKEQKTAALETWEKLSKLTDRQLEGIFNRMPDEAFSTPKLLNWLKSLDEFERFSKRDITNHFKQRRDEFKEAYEKLLINT